MMRIKQNSGFTLLEVLVAVLLFSFVFLLFGAFFINSFTISTKQDSEVVAINLARQIAEQWKIGNECVNTGLDPNLITCKEQKINNRDYYPVVFLQDYPPIKLITVNIYSSSERISSNLLSTITLAED
ncbi:prepilin-type N-terminal cleavage/methylation domain-containing protein [Ammoniphilus sp. CFH 90114]|uniref:prepilin-type N-terminal cleavage/methylation domain-containing protein n=1 Tax=Ammoniphilus sp. CFH 90114 TaxID=2493665 RepID=UPI00100EB50F|nr:prepilin-type N-terminal cleavage/methylation domain-containing protein [Ammoniphilus sp. CFH 90114]RXT14686.1 prepilin-type N-terminal cleavage/methylation domain-containing protein [Ammoniphilus sp. CFH 90114]